MRRTCSRCTRKPRPRSKSSARTANAGTRSRRNSRCRNMPPCPVMNRASAWSAPEPIGAAARRRRRGDRLVVRSWPKADIPICTAHVHFRGHGVVHCKCLLLTQSGQEPGLSHCGFEPIRCPVLSHEEAMKRRDFISLLGGAVAAWPLAARAQQPERVRRVGGLGGLAENDPEMKERIAGLRQGLERLGWVEGSTLRDD